MAIRRFSYDDETGEVVTYDVDVETGESIVDNQLPSLYIDKTPPKSQEMKPKYMKFPRGVMCKTKRYQSLKEKIISGCNPISYRMLLIPSVLILPGLFCIMLMIFEVYLHVRCHQKNKKLKNTNVYYRSPFHVVTSTFCAVCRENDLASKVGQLQDQRRDRYDYFRGLAL